MPASLWRRAGPSRAAAPLAALLTAACAGGAPPTGAAPLGTASDARWRALARLRPEPVEGAARLAVSGVDLLASPEWAGRAMVAPELGVAELVVAGLLRRRDVRFVERRRFAAAAEGERRGLPRARGAPSAGVSAGAELTASAVWAPLGSDSAVVDVRLVDATAGHVRATWRGGTTADAGPVRIARTVVGGILAALSDLDLLPMWNDPEAPASVGGAAPRAPSPGAVAAFFGGLAAEERWEWEEARRGYEAALTSSTEFFEAAAALARTARLRRGGTLGES